MKYIVDTHVLLWYLAGSPRLSAAAAAILQDSSSDLVLPATAYAEAGWSIKRGRLPLLNVVELQSALNADKRFTVYPLDRRVIDRSQKMTLIGEMHDQQIVATALVLADQGEQVMLIIHDKNITQTRLAPMVW